jgi:hypothetical protein
MQAESSRFALFAGPVDQRELSHHEEPSAEVCFHRNKSKAGRFLSASFPVVKISRGRS